jgi:hypothetical protein
MRTERSSFGSFAPDCASARAAPPPLATSTEATRPSRRGDLTFIELLSFELR